MRIPKIFDAIDAALEPGMEPDEVLKEIMEYLAFALGIRANVDANNMPEELAYVMRDVLTTTLRLELSAYETMLGVTLALMFMLDTWMEVNSIELPKEGDGKDN